MRRDNGAARTRQYCCGCLACASPMRHECNGNDTRHRTSGLRDPQSVRGALRGATFRCGCVVFLQRCAACRAARRRTPLNGASWKDATMSSRGVIHHRSRAIAMGRPRSGIVGDARWDPRHRMQRRSCAVAPRAGRRWSSLGSPVLRPAARAALAARRTGVDRRHHGREPYQLPRCADVLPETLSHFGRSDAGRALDGAVHRHRRCVRARLRRRRCGVAQLPRGGARGARAHR